MWDAIKKFNALLDAGEMPDVDAFVAQHAESTPNSENETHPLKEYCVASVYAHRRSAGEPFLPTEVFLRESDFRKYYDDPQVLARCLRVELATSSGAVDLEELEERFPRHRDMVHRLHQQWLLRGASFDQWTASQPRGTLSESAAPANATNPPLPGGQIVHLEDDYEIVQLIGRGGQSMVYEAIQRSTLQRVALKVGTMEPDLSAPESTATLGNHGTRGVIQAVLDHQGIPPLFTLRADERGPTTIVEKLIDGPDWKPHFPYQRDDLQVLLRVARIIAHAHSRGVIHRDIKPANVKIRGDEVYVVDWALGLSLDDSDGLPGIDDVRGRIQGTWLYMAPEMAEGRVDQFSRATDVYLLGSVLFEVLCGEPPFTFDEDDWFRWMSDGGSLAFAAVNLESPKARLARRGRQADVPGELESIAAIALHPDPEQRYRDAAAFADALSRFLRHEDAERLIDTAVAELADLRRERPILDSSKHRAALADLANRFAAARSALLPAQTLARQSAREADATTDARTTIDSVSGWTRAVDGESETRRLIIQHALAGGDLGVAADQIDKLRVISLDDTTASLENTLQRKLRRRRQIVQSLVAVTAAMLLLAFVSIVLYIRSERSAAIAADARTHRAIAESTAEMAKNKMLQSQLAAASREAALQKSTAMFRAAERASSLHAESIAYYHEHDARRIRDEADGEAESSDVDAVLPLDALYPRALIKTFESSRRFRVGPLSLVPQLDALVVSDSVSGELYCWDLADGSMRWSTPTVQRIQPDWKRHAVVGLDVIETAKPSRSNGTDRADADDSVVMVTVSADGFARLFRVKDGVEIASLSIASRSDPESRPKRAVSFAARNGIETWTVSYSGVVSRHRWGRQAAESDSDNGKSVRLQLAPVGSVQDDEFARDAELIAVSDDSQKIALSDDSGRLSILQVVPSTTEKLASERMAPKKSLRLTEVASQMLSDVTQIRFQPGSSILWITSGAGVSRAVEMSGKDVQREETHSAAETGTYRFESVMAEGRHFDFLADQQAAFLVAKESGVALAIRSLRNDANVAEYRMDPPVSPASSGIVDFVNDQSVMALADSQSRVLVCDIRSGKLQWATDGVSYQWDPVIQVAAAAVADEVPIAITSGVASDSFLRVWDTASLTQTRLIRHSTHDPTQRTLPPRVICLSSGGKYAVTGEYSGRSLLLDVQKGKVIREIGLEHGSADWNDSFRERHPIGQILSNFSGLDWNPDRPEWLSLDCTNTIRIWNPAEEKPVHQWAIPADSLVDRRAATLTLHEQRRAKPAEQALAVFDRYQPGILSVQFNGRVRRHAIDTGEVEAEFSLPVDGPNSITQSRDGKHLAVGTSLGKVIVVDRQSEKTIFQLELPHLVEQINRTASSRIDMLRKPQLLSDGDRGSDIAAPLTEFPSCVRSMAISNSGRWLAITQNDGVLSIIEIPSGKLISRTLMAGDSFYFGPMVSFTKDDQLLGIGQDGVWRCWDFLGSNRWQIADRSNSESRAQARRSFTRGATIQAFFDSVEMIPDELHDRFNKGEQAFGSVNSVYDFDSSGNLLASAPRLGGVKVFKRSRKSTQQDVIERVGVVTRSKPEVSRTWRPDESMGTNYMVYHSVAFHPSAPRFAASAEDGTLELIDVVRNGGLSRREFLGDELARAASNVLRWSPSGRYLYQGGVHGNGRLLDFGGVGAEGSPKITRQKFELRGQNAASEFTCVAVGFDENSSPTRIATLHAGGYLAIWDVGPIARYTDVIPVSSLALPDLKAFFNDGEVVVSPMPQDPDRSWTVDLFLGSQHWHLQTRSSNQSALFPPFGFGLNEDVFTLPASFRLVAPQ